MEHNELQSAWNEMKTPDKSTEEIKLMLRENKHPVLKRIRIQLTWEIILWSAFLVVYYSMFDGYKKPIWINSILVSAVGLSILHNLLGYRNTKFMITGTTLKESLETYLTRFKQYAVVSVLSRIVLMAGFLLFFSYGLTLNATKLGFIVMLILTFLIQVFFLYRLWFKRYSRLAAIVQGLTSQ